MTETQTTAPAQEPSDPAAQARRDLSTSIGELVGLLGHVDRADLADRAVAARARLERPSTIVCVVGEFKQGKSSLVNGLVGQRICPVDDDLATCVVTLLHHAETPSATVRQRDGEELVKTDISVDDIGSWASEQGNPDNQRRVERVDIGLPSPILKNGLVIVDSPGMGGLGAGHAAATLSFLPFADGLVFVTDGSQEMTKPEADFLQQATDLCPTVLMAQTKTDLYPEWRRIFDLNAAHLAGLGIELPMIPVSNHLRAQALEQRDRALNDRSGYPELLQHLASGVIEPAKDLAAARAINEGRSTIGHVRSSLASELEVLEDPSRQESIMAELREAEQKLEHLRGPGAKWAQMVGDRMTDLSTEITHRFRGDMRRVGREIDQAVEEVNTAKQWDDIVRVLQGSVAEAVMRVVTEIERGRLAIAGEVAEMLGEEDLHLPADGFKRADIDVLSFWTDKDIDPEKKATKVARGGLTGIRGAQGGLIMFGMMGQFLPAAAATIVASNPVLLGAGAIFGGIQLFDERKRKIAARRQTARMQSRQFIDDVQFEVGNEIASLIRTVQRELRDEFGERLSELQRTYGQAIQAGKEAAQRDQASSQQRQQHVNKLLAALETVERHLEDAAAPIEAEVWS